MSIPYGTLRDIADELKNIREILEKQTAIKFMAFDKVFEVIDKAPSKEPIRAEGAWIYAGQYPYDKCSLCGTLVDSYDGWNYCPNCGAKMKGADDE